MSTEEQAARARGGRCAIVGRPNVGKSTLLNALLGQKLVIATPRPGTTRSNVLGVYQSQDPPTQIAFVDTPGIARPKTALHRALVDTAREGLAQNDVVLLVTDVGKKGHGERHPGDADVLAAAREPGVPIVVAINKVDRLADKSALLPLLEVWHAEEDVVAVVPISATRKTNLEPLVAELRAQLGEELLYDADVLTDRPERFFVSELIREALIRHVRDEIPYGAAVVIEVFDEHGPVTRISATVVVEKPTHKKIVIGAGGSMLKTIGTEARLEIERLMERRVFLELWVKVIPGWTSDPSKLRGLVAGTGS